MAKHFKPRSGPTAGSAMADRRVGPAGDRRETLEGGAKPPASPDPGVISEFAEFLRENKKWWLVPIVASLLLLAALTLLTASPAAPFIYTLF